MPTRDLLLLAALGLPVLASAQTMPERAVLRGGPVGLSLSDGEPISYLIEHSSFLELTEEQSSQLMEVRRRLRAQTAPFMRQLDSLRELVGLSLEPRRRTANDARALARFQRESRPIIDSIRAWNDLARREARLILDSLQLVLLDSLIQMEGRGGQSALIRGTPRARADTGVVRRLRLDPRRSPLRPSPSSRH